MSSEDKGNSQLPSPQIKLKSPQEQVPLPFTLQVTSWKGQWGLRVPTELGARSRLKGLRGDAWGVCQYDTSESCFCKYDTQAKAPVWMFRRDSFQRQKYRCNWDTTASRGRWQLREILRTRAWNMESSLIVLLDSLTVFPGKSGTHWTKTLLKYPLKWEKESILLSQQPRVLNELVEDLRISRMNFKQLFRDRGIFSSMPMFTIRRWHDSDAFNCYFSSWHSFCVKYFKWDIIIK